MDGDSDKTIDSDELEELKDSQKKSRSSPSSSKRKSPVKGSKKNLDQNRVSDSASSDDNLKKKKRQSHKSSNNSDTDKTMDSDELEDFIASSQKKDSVSKSDKKRRLKLEKMSDSEEEESKKSIKSMSDKSSKRALPMKSLGLWSDSDSEKEINKKKVKERVSRKKSQPMREEISDSDSCSENIRNKCKTALTEKSQSDQIQSLGLWSDSENEIEGEKNESFSGAKSNAKFKNITDSSMSYGVSKKKTNLSSGLTTKFDSDNKDFQNNSNAIFPSTSKVSNSEKFKHNNLNIKQPSSYSQISDSDSEEKIINTDKSNERALGKRTHSKYKEISDSDSDNEVVRKKANTSAVSNTVAKEKKTSKNVSSQLSHSRYLELSDSDNEAVPNNIQKDLGSKKEKCRYGKNCYRKNPDHLRNFDHGSDTDVSVVKKGDKKMKNSPTNSSSNRQNISKENMKNSPSTSKVEPSKEKYESGNVNKPTSPGSKGFEFYLTKVNGISQKYNSLAYDIKDLLSFKDGTLTSSAQFNYMFDVPWLLQQYPEKYRKCPLTIVHGEQKQSKAELEKVCSAYPNIKLCQAKLDIPFGTHHTKMMFLLYKEGFRIVIHTSNIVDSDWGQRTQGMWISSLLPEMKNPSTTEGESPTNFKEDLLKYLAAYNASGLNEWIEVIKKHNFSSVRVALIGSVPGRFNHARKTAFGHLKLRKVLNLHGSSMNVVLPNWPLVCQFSSIGSLGTTPVHWLTSEFCSSLSTVKDSSLSCQSNIKLVFPTVENVRKSLQGYPAGASLPYSIKVAQKQPYLRDFMHQWKSDKLGRSEASPHIKTYLRLSPDNCNLAWFLLTSANLSKAAWGSLEKRGTQFMIRSYELGVLFLPKFFELEMFSTPFSAKKDFTSVFPIPYDIPLESYSNDDEIWTWDIPHVHAPDRYGMKWCPPGLK